MICPECERLGLESRFNEHRVPPQGAPVERFYDKDGARHIHDHARYKTVWACTNNHSFLVEREDRCPCKGCDWNQRPFVLAGEKKPGEA